MTAEKASYDELVLELAHLRQRLAERETADRDRGPAEETLATAHDELEERVAKRTAELAHANKELRVFRMFAESSGRGFGMSDLGGYVTYMNPTLLQLLGAERPEDAIGKHVSIYYPEDYKRTREEEMLPALLRDGVWQGELMIRSRHGRLIPVLQHSFLIRDENGAPFRYAVAIADISELKETLAALKASEEKYRTLVETSPDGVIMADLKGHITYASGQLLEDYRAQTPEDLVGKNPLDCIAPEDHQRFLANLRRTVEEGITRDIEYTLLRKTGAQFPAEISAAVIRDACGRPAALVAIIRDITERKRTEQALLRERRTLEHLLHASDHERQLIAYDIHDGLAQQLAGAIMQFQIFDLLKNTKPQDAANAYHAGTTLLQQSHFEARRLISGVRPPVLDEAGVVEAVAHLVHEQSRASQAKIDFRSKVRFDRLAAVLENAIYRITQEALSNACNHSRSVRIRVSLLQREHHLYIEVRDWGVGFEPKPAGAGRFGLEGIRERARLLGGRWRIQSSLGKGTRVAIVLPLPPRNNHG